MIYYYYVSFSTNNAYLENLIYKHIIQVARGRVKLRLKYVLVCKTCGETVKNETGTTARFLRTYQHSWQAKKTGYGEPQIDTLLPL